MTGAMAQRSLSESSGRKLAVDLRDLDGQFGKIVYEDVVCCTVHVRKVAVFRFVDRNAEGMNAQPFRLQQSLTRILNPIIPIVPIIIIRFPVAQGDKQPCPRFDLGQQFGEMPDWRAESGILQGPQISYAALDHFAVRLMDSLDAKQLTPLSRSP